MFVKTIKIKKKKKTLNVQLTNEEIKHGAQVIKQAAESIFG